MSKTTTTTTVTTTTTAAPTRPNTGYVPPEQDPRYEQVVHGPDAGEVHYTVEYRLRATPWGY